MLERKHIDTNPLELIEARLTEHRNQINLVPRFHYDVGEMRKFIETFG